MMDEFLKVSDLRELIDNKGITRKLEDDDIALVKLNGEIFAFMNVCPHQHTPLIDKYGGQIAGSNLTCPMHGWTYNLKTGECINESGKLKMLEVKIEDGNIFVRKFVRNQNW
jgi:nitrite reductase/ring-hydroxylating ferredoxin subunit